MVRSMHVTTSLMDSSWDLSVRRALLRMVQCHKMLCSPQRLIRTRTWFSISTSLTVSELNS